MYSITQIKLGTAIQLDGEPYVVTQYSHSKQARGGGVAKVAVRNLKTGAVLQKTFQGKDMIAPADVGFSKAQHLYKDGENHVFMDSTSYEQFELGPDQLGDASKYLLDGMDVDVQNFEGNPIGVKLPPKVDLEVVETTPGVKGDTASGGTKPATTVTGLVVNVPLFIKEGDKIRVNTETGDYTERAS